MCATGNPKQISGVIGRGFSSVLLRQLHITVINVLFIHLLWSVDDFLFTFLCDVFLFYSSRQANRDWLESLIKGIFFSLNKTHSNYGNGKFESSSPFFGFNWTYTLQLNYRFDPVVLTRNVCTNNSRHICSDALGRTKKLIDREPNDVSAQRTNVILQMEHWQRVQTVKPEIFWLDKGLNYMLSEKLNMCSILFGLVCFFPCSTSISNSLKHQERIYSKSLEIWKK